ncbi:MAG: TolC family protein [Rhodocyclaceae bacterium]|nr:TolC family protein [Rhodocyclaceae bacterium]
MLNNPEVLAKFHAFKASIGDVSVAESGYYPKVDLNSGVAREQIKRAGIVDNDFTRSSHTLSLSQVLYDGYATGYDIKRIDKTRLVRYYELVDTAEAAALEAARVYFDVIRFRMMVFGREQFHRPSIQLRAAITPFASPGRASVSTSNMPPDAWPWLS